MTLATLLTQAHADGVTVTLDPPDRLKLRGDPATVARWAPRLRPHKDELVDLLTPRHMWWITESDGTTWRSCFAPAATLTEVLAGYPDRTTAEAADLPTIEAEPGSRHEPA